jgi:hypothetical protein
MPVLTANHALAAAAGALALTLYERGVFQSVWAALQGPDIGLALGDGAPPGGGGAATQGIPPPAAQTAAGGLDFAAAGNAVIAQGAPGGGSDWLNWCLNWVNRTYQALGHPLAALGAPTAAAACSGLSLRPGVAPKGAIVCFAPTPPNPDGHIGLANGNNTYTSAGVTHGGLSVLDYLGNPLYRGWSNG